MTPASIILVHSQLQQDPNEETTALPRVLIHQIDNTTFCNMYLHSHSGLPPHVLLSRFQPPCTQASPLHFPRDAIKQWLNRYGSVDMQDTATERRQNCQRKLYCIITWDPAIVLIKPLGHIFFAMPSAYHSRFSAFPSVFLFLFPFPSSSFHSHPGFVDFHQCYHSHGGVIP